MVGWMTHQLDSTRQVFGQIIATSADVTPNAGLVAEFSQKCPKHSGLENP